MNVRRHFTAATSGVVAFALSLVFILSFSFPAFAQEFQKVDDSAREQMPATPFVGAAYGFIWVAILIYVLFVARRFKRVDVALQELRSRLQRAGVVDEPQKR